MHGTVDRALEVDHVLTSVTGSKAGGGHDELLVILGHGQCLVKDLTNVGGPMMVTHVCERQQLKTDDLN